MNREDETDESDMQPTYNLAVQEYRAGNIAQAELICRRVLKASPDHVDALRLLGLLTLQKGLNVESQQLLRRAVALAPTSAQMHNDLGTALAAGGQINEALGAFRSAWKLQPRNLDIAMNLGMTLMQTRAFEEAVQVLGNIAVVRPNDVELHICLGDAQRELGRLQAAIHSYTAADTLHAGNAQVQLRLGVAYAAAGRSEEACAAYRRAAELSPQLAEAYFHLGNALKRQKRMCEAAEAYGHALAARPSYAEALHNLGMVFEEESRWEDAVAAFRQVVKLRPSLQSAFHGLGLSLRAMGKLEDAIVALRQAVALDPNSFDSLILLADCVQQFGTNQEALGLYRQALVLRPDNPLTLVKCGDILDRGQNPDAAMKMFSRALEILPNYPEAVLNRAICLLRQGQFEEGWKGYDARWHIQKRLYDREAIQQPLWNGEDLRDRRLLLHLEQGMGDSIQFARYIPLLVGQGARVIVRCPPALLRLFSENLGVQQVLTKDEPLPDFDFHLPLLSVPRVMGTTLDTIPAQVPYLLPSADLVEHWRSRLSSDSSKIRIGLAWAGSPTHGHDRIRSMPFAEFAPLRSVRHASFYSLQVGLGRNQITESAGGLPVTDLGDELHDFADTAAAMMNLDLVVSVDTAVAHLAGALGRTTWLLLPHSFEWRWLLKRSDSPWYPTMRIYHQNHPGDWTSVMREVVAELLKR
ncbi:MAG TPA: tetratricopeptide repeat protein [Tepidisphaeraceae bacterium]|jgi:tetratricopeptide (TPR) repeat protein